MSEASTAQQRSERDRIACGVAPEKWAAMSRGERRQRVRNLERAPGRPIRDVSDQRVAVGFMIRLPLDVDREVREQAAARGMTLGEFVSEVLTTISRTSQRVA